MSAPFMVHRVVTKIDDEISVKDFLDDVVKYVKADLAFQAGKFTRWSVDQKSRFITAQLKGFAPSKFIFADVHFCLEYAEDNEQVNDIEYYKDWLASGVSYLNIDSNNRTINLIGFSKDEFPILPGQYQVGSWVW